MIRIFNQSRINLNLSNASIPIGHSQSFPTTLGRLVYSSLDDVPFRGRFKSALRNHLYRIAVSRVTLSQSSEAHGRYREQIKGRNFEVPGCGGFLMSSEVEDLESYYDIGKEVVCFEDLKDLVDLAQYYLHHDDQRKSIASAGYKRTIEEHTYAHRFKAIFDRIGLSSDSNHSNGMPGRTTEVT